MRAICYLWVGTPIGTLARTQSDFFKPRSPSVSITTPKVNTGSFNGLKSSDRSHSHLFLTI
ncbi:MAG: hypothetical protein KME17_11985 [Cyanosarcina radialis HA8281-LM2]|nr:hypothetical protein [Cyanosarcina radialis HA8281-LM2]